MGLPKAFSVRRRLISLRWEQEMTSPYVSVIVPVFNSEDLIAKCLRAIRGQEGVDPDGVEIIVVDDASTDSSAQRSQRICDKLIILERNSGAATARNRGATEAAGDILVFVDADVILESIALSFVSPSQ